MLGAGQVLEDVVNHAGPAGAARSLVLEHAPPQNRAIRSRVTCQKWVFFLVTFRLSIRNQVTFTVLPTSMRSGVASVVGLGKHGDKWKPSEAVAVSGVKRGE